MQLDALPLGALPAPLDQGRVGLGEVAGLGQQQRHRLLGRREDVRLGRVHHHHALGGGRVDVHVVEADARPADDHQVRPGLDDLGGDLGGGADDEAVRARDRLEQRRRVEPLPHIDLVAGVTQKVQPARRDRLGHQYPGHCAPRLGSYDRVSPNSEASRLTPSTRSSSPNSYDIRK